MESDRNNSNTLALQPYIPKPEEANYIASFSADRQSKQITVHGIAPTSNVQEYVRKYVSEIWREATAVFVEVIKKQRELIDYNGHYIAFLLDQLTEDEFAEISAGYVRETSNGNGRNVKAKTLTLLSATGISFSSADLAYFWGSSEEEVEKALHSLEEEHLITHDKV